MMDYAQQYPLVRKESGYLVRHYICLDLEQWTVRDVNTMVE